MTWTVAGITAEKAKGAIADAVEHRLKEQKRSLPTSITAIRDAIQAVADIPYEEAQTIVEESEAFKLAGYRQRPLMAVETGPTSSGVTKTFVAPSLDFDVFS